MGLDTMGEVCEKAETILMKSAVEDTPIINKLKKISL